jgi:hypothetical protein
MRIDGHARRVRDMTSRVGDYRLVISRGDMLRFEALVCCGNHGGCFDES